MITLCIQTAGLACHVSLLVRLRGDDDAKEITLRGNAVVTAYDITVGHFRYCCSSFLVATVAHFSSFLALVTTGRAGVGENRRKEGIPFSSLVKYQTSKNANSHKF